MVIGEWWLVIGEWWLVTGDWGLVTSNQQPATSNQQPATIIQGGLGVLSQIDGQTSRLEVIFADDAYRGERMQEAAATLGARVQIAKKPTDQKGFAVVPKRWAVERTFALLV